MVGREVIGAHYGWRDWLLQRVTAVVMLAYTLLFLGVVCSLPERNFDHWKALWEAPLMRYATVLFTLSVLLHAWVGVRNIFMDYVKATSVRLVLYVVVIMALVAYGVWTVQILWGA